MDKQTQKELLRIVEQNYDEIATEYNETRKKSLGKLWEILIQQTKGVAQDSKVFDVGCGNGRLLEAFIGKKVDYLGIDQSEKLLSLAKERYPKYQFKLGNILDLGQIPEYNFDYVFSIALLHHIPSKELQIKALKQLRNKIKPGGRLIVTVWNMWNQTKYRPLILRFWLLRAVGKSKMDLGDILFDWKNPKAEKVSKRYYHAFRKSELKNIAKKAGLKKIRILRDKYNYYLLANK